MEGERWEGAEDDNSGLRVGQTPRSDTAPVPGEGFGGETVNVRFSHADVCSGFGVSVPAGAGGFAERRECNLGRREAGFIRRGFRSASGVSWLMCWERATC